MKVLGTTKYIKVSEETHQALTDLGSKGESYDAILVRLIEYHRQGVNVASGLLKPVVDESKTEASG